MALDSVKKLLPKGYYLLNEQGAKLSIKAKIDADAYLSQWKIADAALGKSTGELMKVTTENILLKNQNERQQETIRLMEKKLFWANWGKYAGLSVSAVLAVRLLLK